MSDIYINEPVTKGKVCLTTTVGDIDIELWSKECPLACRNFVQLCMEGYYNGCVFHRLVKDFIVQGGDPTGTGHGGDSIYDAPFKDEIHSRIRFGRRGMVAMANAGGKNENGSQFFFTLAPTMDLQGKHTIFGKVVAPTIFNMLRLGEGDVDKSERPSITHKILSANILINPFNDIVPRDLKKLKRSKEKKEEKQEPKGTKNFALLSFGEEAEEEEQIKLSRKAKSAHDAGDSVGLSTELAVRPEELGSLTQNPEDSSTSGDKEEVRSRIREKLQSKMKTKRIGEEMGDDDDLAKVLEDDKRALDQEQMDVLKSELRAVQKEYKRALRKPKEGIGEVIDEEPSTEGMRVYTTLKMKFKSKTTGIVKQKDPNRESQTMAMLERFRNKLAKSNQEAILFDRKVDMEETVVDQQPSKSDGEPSGDDEEEQEPPGLDLDAEDMRGDDWMAHRFVAPEEDPSISRAKDANLRETSEDWFVIDDPRNPMNQRRRAEEMAEVVGGPSASKKPR